ncbi:MAG: sensor histidine kinase [Gemmatimonadota bacterium]
MDCRAYPGGRLAGLTIQLEAARALLAAQGDPGQALGHVEQGHRLAAAALTETREAVAALREDLRPLPELLADLVGSHRDQAGGGASFAVRGTPRPLAPAATLALYRGAQEALTNARRHAPGACVQAELRYEAREAVLTVGPGYGLTGMRERAELAGGSLQAGPGDGGWRVELRVPA